MQNDEITFSFGANWQSYLEGLTQERVTSARADIESWLGVDGVEGKRVVDIGCGSGIHSLCFYGLGAESLVSFDVDPKSVAATRSLWERAGRPSNWQVVEGSILDSHFVATLAEPGFDLVYSWGVASVGEVVEFTRQAGLVLEKIQTAFEGGNNVFLLSRLDDPCMPGDHGGVQG